MGNDANETTTTATAATDPRPTDVPSIRDDYDFVPGQLAGLAPREGYHGVIALVPVDESHLRVALFVKATTRGGVSWLPPRGTVIMDVPAGFAIQDADAITAWLKRATTRGKPGPIGPVVD